MPEQDKPKLNASEQAARRSAQSSAVARVVAAMAARLTGLDAGDAMGLLAGQDAAVLVLQAAGDPDTGTVAYRAELDADRGESQAAEADRLRAELAEGPKVLLPAECMTLMTAGTDGMPPWQASRLLCPQGPFVPPSDPPEILAAHRRRRCLPWHSRRRGTRCCPLWIDHTVMRSREQRNEHSGYRSLTGG